MAGRFRNEIGVTFRYAGRIRSLFLASHKNPLAQRILKSTEAISRDRGKQLMNNIYIIHPFSDARWFWDLIRCIFIIVLTFTESLLLTFEFIGVQSQENISKMRSLIFLLNSIFFIDIIINFFTGYYDKDKRCIQMNLKDIAKHYLTTRFVIHVIFSIPWYALAYYRKIDVECINDSCKVIGDDYRDVFSLLSFSRIIRIPEVSEVLNTLENNTLRFKFVYQALNIFSYALILFHFASCAQLNVHGIVLNMGDTDVSNSWVIKENFSELYGSGLVNQYGKTLYRASICLMLYGGISVNESIADRTLTSVLRIIGLMYLVYLLSYFIVILKSLNWGRRNFQYVMKNMNEMSKFKRLNQFQKDRIDHYMRYKYDWKFFNEMEVKAVLSTHLMNEIQDYCNRRAVEKVNLFESLPSNAKSLIVSSLKEDIYLPGDTIIEASVKGDCMYFLSIGKVAVYDPSGNEITHLKDGSYFGEVAMISDKAVRTASVVAIDICEVFVLYKHDFRSIIKPYPDLFATLRESVENILTTRMKDNVKYCKTKYSMIIESIEHLLHTVPIDNDNVE